MVNQSFLDWVSVSHLIAKIGFGSSIFFGSVLLTLNFCGAQKVANTYKLLMNSFTILGIVFATMEVILNPNIHSYNMGCYYFSQEKSFGMSRDYVIMFLGVYKCFYCSTTALISVQFIYRYWAVFNDYMLKYFRGWYWLIWPVYCLSLGTTYAVGACVFIKIDDVSEKYFSAELFNKYGFIIEETSGLALLAYDPNDGSVRWRNLTFIICITGVMSVQYAVMIYCGWSMFSQMEAKLQNFSVELKRLHKQFFKTLVLQISAPTLFLFVPIGFLIYLPLLNIKHSLPTGSVISAFSLYPAMDALIVMSVVTEYKVTAQKLLKKLLKLALKFLNSLDEVDTTVAVTRSPLTRQQIRITL